MTAEAIKKLQNDIKKFLEVYKFLSVEGKAQFEAQMAGQIKDLDEKTKNLYQALLQAAKDGSTIDEAINKMHESSG